MSDTPRTDALYFPGGKMALTWMPPKPMEAYEFACTLERELAAIKSQPVPVEPPIVTNIRFLVDVEATDGQVHPDSNVQLIHYIDSLQSALQVAQQERDKEAYLHKLDHSLADRWLERAKKAEGGDARDAARYRWLRNHPLLQQQAEIDVRQFKFPRATWAQIAYDELDAAIDAAMQNERKE